MQSVDFIRTAFEMSNGWVGGIIADMADAPLTAPTPNGGNHPLWIAGHLAYAEGNLIHQYVAGKENPVADWEEMFNAGTDPSDDASKYPPMEEVLEKFQAVRSGTMEILANTTDADLDKPSQVPEEMKEFFGTNAQCWAAALIHIGFHGGQAADARRAAGRPPLMG